VGNPDARVVVAPRLSQQAGRGAGGLEERDTTGRVRRTCFAVPRRGRAGHGVGCGDESRVYGARRRRRAGRGNSSRGLCRTRDCGHDSGGNGKAGEQDSALPEHSPHGVVRAARAPTGGGTTHRPATTPMTSHRRTITRCHSFIAFLSSVTGTRTFRCARVAGYGTYVPCVATA